MEKTFWERLQELKESINSGVEPMRTVQFSTRIVKLALAFYLAQTFVLAMWWSIKDAVFYPWFFFISSVLQVGWIWNKVTSYWLYAQGYRLVRQDFNSTPDEEYSEYSEDDSIHAPSIKLTNEGVI